MFPKDFEKFASGRLAFGLASRLPKRAAGVGFVMSSLLGRPVAAGQTHVSTGSAWLSQTVSSSLLLIHKHPGCLPRVTTVPRKFLVLALSWKCQQEVFNCIFQGGVASRFPDFKISGICDFRIPRFREIPNLQRFRWFPEFVHFSCW